MFEGEIVMGDDEPRTTCCSACVQVERQVQSVVSYRADTFRDGVLTVHLRKTLDSDPEDWEVSCCGCGTFFEVEVIEQ